MMPALNIVYNSQGGNSHLGIGWSLAGVSVISRDVKSRYYDNEAKAVTYTADDAFSLDGSRLVGLTGAYGSAGATYRKDAEDFSAITSFGSIGSGPEKFEVVTKDGRILQYGGTANSRMLSTATGGEVQLWFLSKVQDAAGNYIEYIYDQSGRDPRLTEIRYTGNTALGLTPYNSIKFYYSLRTDKTTVYSGGSPQKTERLLDKIEVYTDGTLTVRHFQFKYAYSNTNSLLKEIEEWGSGVAKTNSTIVKYGNKPAEMATGLFNNAIAYNADFQTGDFDGDGLDDVLALHKTTYYGASGAWDAHDEFRVYKRTASIPTYSLAGTTALVGTANTVESKIYPNSVNDYSLADYSGDAQDDICVVQWYADASGNKKLDNVRVYVSGTGATSFSSTSFGAPSGFNTMHPTGRCLYSGDFDGDDLTDFITILRDGTGYRAFYTKPYGSATITNEALEDLGTVGASYPATLIADADKVFIIDFDGDGKSEFMVIEGAMTYIYTIVRDGAGFKAAKLFEAGYPTTWHRVWTGDFNGDGLTDLFTRASATLWEVAYSTGKAWSSVPFSFAPGITPNINSTYSPAKTNSKLRITTVMERAICCTVTTCLPDPHRRHQK